MQRSSMTEPPVFDGTNYPEWKIKMECFIQAIFGIEAWISVIDGWSPPTMEDGEGRRINKPFKDWNKSEREICTLNARVLNAIFCSIGQQQFKRVAFCKTAKEAWETLQTVYGKTRTLRARCDLDRRFCEMEMEEDETISSFHERLVDITYEAQTLGRTFSNDELVQKVLSSLPNSFANIVALINENSGIELGKLICSLKSYEKELEPLAKENNEIQSNKFGESQDHRSGYAVVSANYTY